MPLIGTLIVAAVCIILALALAWVPMRLIVGHITRNIKQYIERKRERRAAARDTPDRRGL
jgi:peptidoglycan/LPS O-acetylase OafA/YrhL